GCGSRGRSGSAVSRRGLLVAGLPSPRLHHHRAPGRGTGLRGYLTRKLVSPAFETVRFGHFTWLSSVAFGLLHGRWLARPLAGMAYAVALYRRRQMGEMVYAHMTTNALIDAYVPRFGACS